MLGVANVYRGSMFEVVGAARTYLAPLTLGRQPCRPLPLPTIHAAFRFPQYLPLYLMAKPRKPARAGRVRNRPVTFARGAG